MVECGFQAGRTTRPDGAVTLGRSGPARLATSENGQGFGVRFAVAHTPNRAPHRQRRDDPSAERAPWSQGRDTLPGLEETVPADAPIPFMTDVSATAYFISRGPSLVAKRLLLLCPGLGAGPAPRVDRRRWRDTFWVMLA